MNSNAQAHCFVVKEKQSRIKYLNDSCAWFDKYPDLLLTWRKFSHMIFKIELKDRWHNKD